MFRDTMGVTPKEYRETNQWWLDIYILVIVNDIN
jgi:hypothetical protein